MITSLRLAFSSLSSKRLRTSLCLSLFALLFAWQLQAQNAQIEGQPVAEVVVQEKSGAPVPEKIPPLPLEEGQPFDFARERASIGVLNRMGDFSNIEVSVEQISGGLRVEFGVERNYYNNVLRIEGVKPPPTEAAATAAMHLNLGEPFSSSAVQAGVESLLQTLRDDGFFLAKAGWKSIPHEDTREMDIIVTVDSGPRALIGDVSIENHTPYTDRELLHHAGLKPNQKEQFTAQRTSHSGDKLKKFLVDHGYLGGGTAVTPGNYDTASNRVPLKLVVNAGPHVRIDVVGARLSTGQKRRLLPMYAEGAADDDLIQEGRRNLRDFLQSQGYFNADVEVNSTGETGSQRTISYQVMRGDRFRLAGVAFKGNKYFDTSLLSRRLLLQPASFASVGKFSQQLLRADVDSIRALYLSNGFREAQVSSMVDDAHQGKKNNLFVTFQITEGTQTHISELTIDGNHAISTDALLAVIGSTKGQPYSEAGVAVDRNNILGLYYNEGFPQADFKQEAMPGASPTEMKLVYHVTEGTRIFVARVLLTGYQYTRPGIMARQVTIKPEQPLRQSDVADTQRQLYNLGVFNRVQIAQQNPSGSDPNKAVVVDVEEGARYTVGYGAGFEVQRVAAGGSNPNATSVEASPRGIFDISRLNLFGRAQTLSFQARGSALEYRFSLTFSANNFANHRNLSLQVTGFADKTQDVATFTSSRFEGGVQLVQKLSSSSSFAYRYFYRRVKASNLAETVTFEEIPLLSAPTLVSGFGITYARDRRDNPADPSHGNFNTIDLSDAIKNIGSNADFFRAYMQNSSFYSLGRSFVFARSVRFGLEVPLGNTTEGNTTFNPAQCTEPAPPLIPDIIPLPERFFAGGGTSLRGFSLNQAGPRDPCTGFPVGGLAVLIFNQELHFPMKLPWIGNKLGGTLLYDAGNVYRDVNHISFDWKSPSLTNIQYFSHTVGFGLRYPTPVGPVRIDIGYQLNPASYRAIITPAGGAPGTGPVETLTVPHIGFSFNIGPVF